MNYKKTIIYTIGCLLLLWIIIKWGSSLVINKICPNKIVEGLTDFEKYSYKIVPYPKDAVINYNDTNSSLYSHTVNMPFNSEYSCKNFCGPQAQCAITRDQCSTDIDCPGCQPIKPPLSGCLTKDVEPYEDSGKLSQNQGLHYSPLTTGLNKDYEETYPGSKYATLTQPYQGEDKWMKSFNQGLNLYNKQRKSYDTYNEGIFQGGLEQGMSSNISDNTPNYPTTVSATGLFYETTPPAANASL